MPTLNIEDLSTSGHILASSLSLSKFLIYSGVSFIKVNDIVEEFILDLGGIPSFKGLGGFPFSICVSVNEVLAHGVPQDRYMEYDDIVKVDIGVSYNGNFTDAARTFYCGNAEEKLALLGIVQEALNKGVGASVAGNKVGDISFAIQKVLYSNGYRSPLHLGGHGIGLQAHTRPLILNYGPPNRGDAILSGMCLAIEPLVIKSSSVTEIKEDGFSVFSPTTVLTGHAEDTIVVTDGAPLILTRVTLEGDCI